MSSDSESDEFYDAEDATPSRPDRSSSNNLTGSELNELSLEEEKQRLLEEKRLAEERLQKEEAEIQRRLEEIESIAQQKHKEEEEKRKNDDELKKRLLQLSDRKAEEKELRRQKLLQMRQDMSDDSTPMKEELIPSKQSDDPNNVPTPNIESDAIETVTFNVEECHNSTPVTLRSDNTNNVDLPVGDHIRTSIQSPDPAATGGNVEHSMKKWNTINRNLDKSDDKSVSKDMTDLSTSYDEDLHCDNSFKKEEKFHITSSLLDVDEPDLIKSTRPKEVLLVPKAPPRRKKRLYLTEQFTDAPEKPPRVGRPGLPPDTVTPNTSIECLVETKSLNIEGAICGERTVTTEILDEEAVKGDAYSIASMESGDSKLDGSQYSEYSSQADPDEDPTRPRSPSGRFLTDKEILGNFIIKNLDTGEAVALSKADEIAPRCADPLTRHIMERTKEYPDSPSSPLESSLESSGQHTISKTHKQSDKKDNTKKRGKKLKQFLGKTVHKIKTKADEVLNAEETSSEEEDVTDGRKLFKFKSSRNHKGPYKFDELKLVQDLSGQHTGAVWTMKFSHCGRLMATGGQDNTLKVWVLKDSYQYFDDMRQKFNATKVSPAPSHESLNSINSASDVTFDQESLEQPENAPFMQIPFCTYRDHTAAVLDISWSKNYFILTSSMDKTCRLWHTSRRECLCCFQHTDFVTAICFHPKDDRYFLSGSLDGKVRLWNIPDKKVALWNEVNGSTKLITAANFCQNGKFAVVGTYDGRCIFYTTEQLKYFTSINVRSTRGKNSRGRKISGIEPIPGEDKVLVTSNDSRIRLYDLRDLTLTCKYKGCTNNSSQIKASFSHNGRYIICGSEDQFFYVWKTHHEFHKFSSVRKDRNSYWEAFRAHTAVVTAAVFAPNQVVLVTNKDDTVSSNGDTPRRVSVSSNTSKQEHLGEVIITADFTGAIKVFNNPKRNKTASL